MTLTDRFRRLFAVLAFVLATFAPSANADPGTTTGPGGPSSGDGPTADDVLVFSNFGAGGTFNTGAGWTIGPTAFGPQVIANSFTPSTTVLFSDAQLAITSFGGTTANVYLETDSGGVPGAIIDTLTQNGAIGSPGVVTWECAQCPSLSAGTQYWLVAQEGNGETAWNYSNSDQTPFAFDTSGTPTGPWSTFTPPPTRPRSAFEIDGDAAVPEPVSVFWLTALLSLGVVGRALYRKFLEVR